MREIPSWHQHFFELAKVISKRSKDEKTQIGAVIVGPGKEVVSTGYNSFPRGINDTIKERQVRPEKYFWFEHAERNAIYNAARTGASLNNCTLYVPALPCTDCARGIIQVGIGQVIIEKKETDRWFKEKHEWWKSMERTKALFDEAKVQVLVYSKEYYSDGYLGNLMPFNDYYWNQFNEKINDDRSGFVK